MARAIRLAFGLASLALIAGCGGERLQPPAPGLSYLCNDEPLTIVYGDGGYVPGGSARPVSHADASGASAGFEPRSIARIIYRGAQHELVADDALQDLRYVEASGDVRLVWTARGETAALGRLMSGNDEVALADCRRVRSVAIFGGAAERPVSEPPRP